MPEIRRTRITPRNERRNERRDYLPAATHTHKTHHPTRTTFRRQYDLNIRRFRDRNNRASAIGTHRSSTNSRLLRVPYVSVRNRKKVENARVANKRYTRSCAVIRFTEPRRFLSTRVEYAANDYDGVYKTERIYRDIPGIKRARNKNALTARVGGKYRGIEFRFDIRTSRARITYKIYVLDPLTTPPEGGGSSNRRIIDLDRAAKRQSNIDDERGRWCTFIFRPRKMENEKPVSHNPTGAPLDANIRRHKLAAAVVRINKNILPAETVFIG